MKSFTFKSIIRVASLNRYIATNTKELGSYTWEANNAMDEYSCVGEDKEVLEYALELWTDIPSKHRKAIQAIEKNIRANINFDSCKNDVAMYDKIKFYFNCLDDMTKDIATLKSNMGEAWRGIKTELGKEHPSIVYLSEKSAYIKSSSIKIVTQKSSLRTFVVN